VLAGEGEEYEDRGLCERVLSHRHPQGRSVDPCCPPSRLTVVPHAPQVASIVIANSADNITVRWPRRSGVVWLICHRPFSFFSVLRQIYTPLFAASRGWKVVVTLIVFYVMLGLWCTMGYGLIRMPWVAKAMTRYGKFLIPLVFIGIGIYILWVSAPFSVMKVKATGS
jgi:hypothetical protein